MAERTKYAPGTPSFTDLTTPDTDAAQQFYGTLFGWSYESNDTGNPDMPYIMAMQDGKAIAGLMKLTPEMASGGMPPVWSTYVTVGDVDASTKKAAGLGATVLSEPMDVMTAGRMSVLADPQGAVFCLWQPKDSIGAELVNTPVSMTWNELLTSDVEGAKTFYSGLFGWKPNTVPVGPVQYTMWELDGSGIGGAVPKPMEQMPSFWAVYFSVADTDATFAKAQELGASVVAEPMDLPDVGRMAALADPQGAIFSIIKNANPAP